MLEQNSLVELVPKKISDRYGVGYGAGADGKSDFEFAGELGVAGHPFLLNSANVN